MTKRTLLLIGFLLLLTIGVIYAALAPKSSQLTTATPTPTPIPEYLLPHSILSLESLPGSTSGQKQIAVTIDTGANKVTGVQLDLSYNPTAASNVSVTSGTFFTTATVLNNKVDGKKGTLSYVIAIQPTASPVSGKGNIAVISYTPLSSDPSFTFTNKTIVTAEGTTNTVLQNTINNIHVSAPSPAK